MKGNLLRALGALLLFGLAAIGSVPHAVAEPGWSTNGLSYDAAVADAKATMLVDPEKTIDKARLVEVAARNLRGEQRIIGVATAQWLQGEAYLRLDDVKHAQPLIAQALAAIPQSPSKLRADILLSKGGVSSETGQVAAALRDYQAAYDIYRVIDETRSRAVALVSIALLYQDAKDYETALRYSSQAIDIYAGDPSILLSIHNNMGVCLRQLGRFSEAEAQFRKALEIARTLKGPSLEVQILRNIIRAELATGQLDAADRTMAEKKQIAHKAGVLVSEEEDRTLGAWAAFLRGRYDMGIALISKNFVSVDLTRTTVPDRESHQIAYYLFRRTGDYRMALAHLEALYRLDAQTSQLASSANTALAAARFDFANQELRIAKLKADELQRNVDFERARARMQEMVFAGIAMVTLIVVAMLAVGLVTLRRSRNEVRAANVDLAETNAALGQALAAKTEFLATTSHEIRTPLNGILGMTQVMLADSALSGPLRDRIGVVHSAGISMRALVDDILDVAKMETGNMAIEHVPMNLKETLGDVSQLWVEQARGRRVGFALDLDDCPELIAGDATRVRQVVFNLLSNAFKFTESGTVGLRVFRTGESAAAAPLVRIEVSDSGIGIPADKLEIIFESFRQVDAGTTRKYGGTGLGLSICRTLARAMGGDVRVASISGSGSTFTLELPLIPVAEVEADLKEIEAEGGLLIVDRNPIARSMLRAMLETHAAHVVFASSVAEAVQRLEKPGIDKVLIDDVTLQTVGHIAASIASIVCAARSTGAATALLSADLDAQQRSAFLAEGVDMIIAKPITGLALARILYPFDDPSVAGRLVTRAA